ncbi:dimethylaniline monooxygenase [N-oxide-forming] 4-like [Diadema antillarum]|uniref:dimethylaniline monooxygenase [N-oxide-forming] 4-like n=1 Tax=Diadema antillarum TaxID=105358 RepID=UPI003A83FBBE
MGVRTVAVVGSGVSGLVSVKHCLEEGMEPVCFEREPCLGGIWVYDDKRPKSYTRGALYDCLVLNSSKQMTNFSDFPYQKSGSPYIQGKEFIKYLKSYAAHFDLERHIRYSTEVLRVERAPDFDLTGRWVVRSRGSDGEERREVYDAVMMCTGLYSERNVVEYPGQAEFEGKVLHSNEYRRADGLANGMNVLVVGGAHSAGDVAVDTSRVSKKTYLSMRKGTWVLQRMAPGGIPRDMYGNRRVNFLKPEWLRRKTLVDDIYSRVNMDNLGLKCTKKLFCSEVMVNDDIGSRAICGAVVCKPGIDHFTKRGVVFTDGTVVDDLGLVVYATGYHLRAPTVDNDIICDGTKDLELYLYVFPPRLKHKTFAAIGFAETMGAHGPVFEMQARYATRVFKGLAELPPLDVMLKDIQRRKNIMLNRYGKYKNFFPAVPYQDMVAERIGARPKFWPMLLTDPVIAFRMFFGPALPYTYRLVGPNTWPGARDAILSAWDNTWFATRTRPVPQSESDYGLIVNVAKTLFFIVALGFIVTVLC